MKQLPPLIRFVNHPRRVTLRFAPLIHWIEDGVRSNFPCAEGIFKECVRQDVKDVRISFATPYGKVLKRPSWSWYDPPLEERLEIAHSLVEMGRSLGLTIYACSDRVLESAGALPSSCIDGRLLSELHP